MAAGRNSRAQSVELGIRVHDGVSHPRLHFRVQAPALFIGGVRAAGAFLIRRFLRTLFCAR